MPQIGLFLLANVFSALLPQVDSDEESYYDVLGVTRTATNEDIRKAYKKLSLKLHPDKLVQCGANDEEKKRAAEEYEHVQEAYSVLVNDEKREKYDTLKTPTRYRFVVERNELLSPGAIYQNLTNGSFTDKTKLVGCTTAFIVLILLQPILIAAKVNQSLEQNGALDDAKWTHIFIPTWIFFGSFILFNVALIKLIPASQRLPMILWSAELFLWFLSLFFLTLRWDDSWTSPYSQVLAPVYLAFIFRLLGKIVVLRKVRVDVQRMVTASFLETNILKGKSLDEMTDEEREELKRAYLVVSVPEDFQPVPPDDGAELDEAKIEEQKVEASAEFEAATEIYNSIFMSLLCLGIFGTTFLLLLTRKLDDKMESTWWIVFTPIWIWLSSRLLVNFYRCSCGTAAGDEILLHMKDLGEQAGDAEGNADEVAKPNDQTDEKPIEEPPHSGAELETMSKSGYSSETELKVATDTSTNEPLTVDERTQTTSTPTTGKEDGSVLKYDKNDIETGTKKVSEDDDNEYVHIDEETFKAWQSAYEQAEETAMQEQAKACTECCNLTAQLTILCLVVAKIEKNYDNFDPQDTGFNTFWILFPFFMFFGLLCCCCALVIYGAAADLEDGVESAGAGMDTEHTKQEEQTSPPIASIDEETGASLPPDENQEKTDTDEIDNKEETTLPTPQNDGNDVESSNMDDLD